MERSGEINRWGYFFIRLGLAAFGCAAVVWGSAAFAITWPQASVEQVAIHIINGEAYRLPVLQHVRSNALAVENVGPCRPSVTRSAAVIGLQIAELEATGRAPREGTLQETREEIVRSLAC